MNFLIIWYWIDIWYIIKITPTQFWRSLLFYFFLLRLQWQLQRLHPPLSFQLSCAAGRSDVGSISSRGRLSSAYGQCARTLFMASLSDVYGSASLSVRFCLSCPVCRRSLLDWNSWRRRGRPGRRRSCCWTGRRTRMDGRWSERAVGSRTAHLDASFTAEIDSDQQGSYCQLLIFNPINFLFAADTAWYYTPPPATDSGTACSNCRSSRGTAWGSSHWSAAPHS